MKIYDELTNEELTSPDLSAGYLYPARRVVEHVPESREVMQGTVTEDDPKGLEHIISGCGIRILSGKSLTLIDRIVQL